MACALLQTTGGKDEPIIVFMQKSEQTSQHRTKNVKKHNRTTQKTKTMSNTFGVYAYILLLTRNIIGLK